MYPKFGREAKGSTLDIRGNVKSPWKIKNESQARSNPNFNHIPLEEIDEALALNDSNFKLIYEIKKPQKDDTIVFYCMAGMRAEDAALQFESVGYEKVHLYPGGWKEWVDSWTREDWEAWSKETGYPLQKKEMIKVFNSNLLCCLLPLYLLLSMEPFLSELDYLIECFILPVDGSTPQSYLIY